MHISIMKWYVLLLILPITLTTSRGLSKISIDPHTGRFKDMYGRERIFHGINSVEKGFPWYNRSMLNHSILRLYKSWGFNLVRLGAMWSGVMPKPETINRTYVGVLRQIVSNLEEHGAYTLLDMHQDVMSSKFGLYDGVPRWLVDRLTPSRLPYPWPFDRPPPVWGENSLTLAASVAFQDLYRNDSRALEYWGDFWRVLARNFFNSTSVIGYELINEPWAGDIYTDPSLILPGNAGKRNLLPVYDYLTSVIRSVDNATIIFYEAVTWGVFFGGAGPQGSGFGRVPGGPANANRAALSYHYYCWILTGPEAHRPYPWWKQLLCDELALRLLLATVAADTAVTGGGRMLTEFGICAPDNHTGSVDTVECETVMRLADEHLQSWTYWDSRFFDAHGRVLWPTVRAFARTYPVAVAGRIASSGGFSFDVASGAFHMRFAVDPRIRMPTEIFVPLSVHYPRGIHVVTTPPMQHTLDGNILKLQPPAGMLFGTNVTVKIASK